MKEELGDVQKFYIDGHLSEDPKVLAKVLKAPIKLVKDYLEKRKSSAPEKVKKENKNFSVMMDGGKASVRELTSAEVTTKYAKSIYIPDPDKKSI